MHQIGIVQNHAFCLNVTQTITEFDEYYSNIWTALQTSSSRSLRSTDREVGLASREKPTFTKEQEVRYMVYQTSLRDKKKSVDIHKEVK